MNKTRGLERRSDIHKTEDVTPVILPPWPDQQARQEMSAAENARDNLGKHSKNPDWERRW